MMLSRTFKNFKNFIEQHTDTIQCNMRYNVKYNTEKQTQLRLWYALFQAPLLSPPSSFTRIMHNPCMGILKKNEKKLF